MSMINYNKTLKQISYLLNINTINNSAFIVIEKDLKKKLNKYNKKAISKTSFLTLFEKKRIHFILYAINFNNKNLLNSYLTNVYKKKKFYNINCSNNIYALNIINKFLIFNSISNYLYYFDFLKICQILIKLKFKLLYFFFKIRITKKL